MSGKEQIDPEILKLRFLSQMAKRLENIEESLEGQVPTGEVHPIVVIVAGAGTNEIDLGVGKWRSVSIFNRGPDDCEVQLNKASLLLASPIPLQVRVVKSFEFLTKVIDKVVARCAAADTATLEVEFTR